MRDAILNIRKSAFKKLLENHGVTLDVDKFFAEAKKHKVSYDIDVKTLQKFAKIQNADKYELFNSILTSSLQVRYNPNASPILIQDSAYNMLKEVSILAVDFCNKAGLSTREGFITYINLGLDIMGKKYAINKFKFYNGKITELYFNSLEIAADPNKELTDILMKYYAYKGKVEVVQSDIIHFVRTAAQITDTESNPRVWMDAQFERFAFTGTIPEPQHLYGEKQLEAYKKVPKEEKSTITLPDNSEAAIMARAKEEREKLQNGDL